jgi:hypothetical protein
MPRGGASQVLAVAAALGCGSAAEPVRVPSDGPKAQEPIGWCAAIEDALETGDRASAFHCLEVPNFLVTGFYGTRANPERSDFVEGCFAGEAKAAERLQLSVRPVGDLRFAYSKEIRVDAGAGLDLAFLGGWAPRLQGSARSAATASVTVELVDAEVRVLSSVAEILGQEYRAAEGERRTAGALEACLESLCDGSGGNEPLVYTAKVLAAVPVIRVRTASTAGRAMAASFALGSAGFELTGSEREDGEFELRGKEKLNIAAISEEARPALERAKTCEAVRHARTRRGVVTGLRALGPRILASRDMAAVSAETAELRTTVQGNVGAFTAHEAHDLSNLLEALEGASRDLSQTKPGKSVCSTRDLLQVILSGSGQDNQLHDLLAEVAQPLHRRLMEVANDHGLACADPAYYRDEDGDGYGDPRVVRRAAKQPSGYVANSLDCFDRDTNARPGQRKYFAEPRADGSFDFDCDGRMTPERGVVAGGCKEITRFGIPIRCWAEPGWRVTAPKCGDQGRWFSECDSGMLSCDEGPDTLERQACR